MNIEAVEKTKQFVKEAFQANPSYSFNDWTVMYNHSIKVSELAAQIADSVGEPVNKTVVVIGGLLHDIGKTFPTDSEILHKEHESFNLKVCGSFLFSLQITEEELKKLRGIVSHNSDSMEMQVIEDADALALYADKRLYMLFIEWARKNNLQAAVERKITKYGKLHFEISRELGESWLAQMKRDWGVE